MLKSSFKLKQYSGIPVFPINVPKYELDAEGNYHERLYIIYIMHQFMYNTSTLCESQQFYADGKCEYRSPKYRTKQQVHYYTKFRQYLVFPTLIYFFLGSGGCDLEGRTTTQ